MGVEVELDQGSEGFQWLVSFFIVFFSETAGKHENAILLLDEPGLSLHALKQRELRETSRARFYRDSSGQAIKLSNPFAVPCWP